MIYDTFSERERLARQEQDPYTYDQIPETLRNQFFHVFEKLFASTRTSDSWMAEGYGEWHRFWNDCCEDRGLPPTEGNDYFCMQKCRAYLMEKPVEDVLSIIDIAFQFIWEILDSLPEYKHQDVIQAYHQANENLNIYFQRVGVGYQLIERKIIKIDSEFLHTEAIVPALTLLREAGFETANETFLTAHEHYRNGNYGDCITNANSAFESTMKAICDQNGWKYGKGTADELIGILARKGLIPGHSQNHFQQLSAILKSGLPPLRHQKSSSHGQGTGATDPTAYMAAYALHLAAANILFLTQGSRTYNTNQKS